MKIRNSFTFSQTQAAVQASPKVRFHPMVTCEDKCHCDLLLPPDFITEHDSIWHGIPFLSVRVNCPGCVPSKIPVHSQSPHWCGWCEGWKMPWLFKHCSATAKTLLCYRQCFQQLLFITATNQYIFIICIQEIIHTYIYTIITWFV